jgi:hypothetical protein
MKSKSRRALLAVGGVVVTAAGFWAARALAGGIPDGTGAMTYAGVLEDAEGRPRTGTGHTIIFALWDQGQPGTGTSRCNVQSPSGGYDLGTTGRFSIALPEGCATAVKAYPNLWVELTVDNSVLPRTKLGVVPYAVEAGHAVNADSATNATNAAAAATANAAGGSLKTKIDGLQSQADHATQRLGPTSDQALDITWGIYHAAAVGACTSLSPVSPGGEPGRAYVLSSGDCNSVCAATPTTTCRGAVAIGAIPLTRGTPGSLIGYHYIYTCNNSVAAIREGTSVAPGNTLYSYCCCSDP